MGHSRHLRAALFGLCAAGLVAMVHGGSWGADDLRVADEHVVGQTIALPAEEAHSPAPPLPLPAAWDGDLATRRQVSGDWFGTRDDLAEQGITFFGDLTQYYQGVVAGGLARQFVYGGRGDYLIDIDSEKLGLWEGGHLDLRAETRFGQDTNGIDGTAAPSNFALALPRPGETVTALTGVQYTHDLSDHLSVYAGKLNSLDGTPASYAQGRRLNYFWNVAMQSNVSRNFLHPSILGAGLTVRDDVEPVFNFQLLDTHYTPTTSGFSTLFDNGVLAYGDYRWRTNCFGRPGHGAVGFLFSNATRTPLDVNAYALLKAIAEGLSLPRKDSSWTVTYRFDQALHVDSDNPERSWTLSGDYGLTDGNPNPIRWFANLSLVGYSPVQSRENDTFGIGYYHLGVSELPILQTLGFGSEDGVELFYNVAVTPWFHVTPDLQIIDPAQRANATAVLVGVRGRISF